MDALEALHAVDFDWTLQVDSVWRTPSAHAEALHQDVRHEVLDVFSRIDQSKANPLGRVIVGPAGAGKTHLLGSLRQEVMAGGGYFILVDMTDVREFWQTVLLGFLDSLERLDNNGHPQYERLIDHLFSEVALLKRGSSRPSKLLKATNTKALLKLLKEAILPLSERYRRELHAHQDVLRALLLLNSKDIETSNAGYSWLQGLELETPEQRSFGLRSPAADAIAAVKGLSWLLSLSNRTLLAFDQLDAIVTEHDLSSGRGNPDQWDDTQRASLAIIQSIAGGLMAIRDKTYSSLSVVACLDATWDIIRERGLASASHRFDKVSLTGLRSGEIAKEIIAKRLEPAYRSVGFTAPYPTYPFATGMFENVGDYSPRRILRRCHEHRQKCLREGAVTELIHCEQPATPVRPPTEPSAQTLDGRFEELRNQADLSFLNIEESEDRDFARLIEALCHCLLIEQQAKLPEHIDVEVDSDFTNRGYPLLHARVRLIDHKQNDRERHFAFRALQRTNATAFQNRLKAAITASGIDRNLPFRHLVIVRTTAVPRGPKSQALLDTFKSAGGILHSPSTDEIKSLCAFAKLWEEKPEGFEAWLQSGRRLCSLPLMHAARLCRTDDKPAVPVARPAQPESPREDDVAIALKGKKGTPQVADSSAAQESQAPKPSGTDTLFLGHRLFGERIADAVAIPLRDLTRHTVILAGAGSGKTVLVRRLIEEAALTGIPALVIDGANDLCRLGSAWPEPPEGWLPGDAEKAKRYFDTTETVIWTPGRERGNPIRLEPLPDLAALVDDSDELEQAAGIAIASLAGIVAPGQTPRSRNKRGILANSLRHFARLGGHGLTEFVQLLAQLPHEAGGDISNAPALAREMADLLRSEMATNPMLRQEGPVLDLNLLIRGDKGKTRISVVNLVGLPSLEAQQAFVAQLAMTLFTWIKTNPAPPSQPLQGLLVIDEAKDFVPSGRSVPSKEPLLRLAAQARKYGLGLIFASQAPKSIDHNVIANCTTQFYGKASSPAAIEVVQTQLRQRGGDGADIPSLPRGRFYVHSEALKAPEKIATPLCLSHHPATPPDEEGVLKLAAASRRALQGLPV